MRKLRCSTWGHRCFSYLAVHCLPEDHFENTVSDSVGLRWSQRLPFWQSPEWRWYCWSTDHHRPSSRKETGEGHRTGMKQSWAVALSAWLQSPCSSPLNLASVSQKCHTPGYWGPRTRTNACHLFLWHFPANVGKHLLSARHIRSTVVHTWNIKKTYCLAQGIFI